MKATSFRNACCSLIGIVLVAGLSGCAGQKMDDLQAFIASEKAKQSASVEPLPEIKPYTTFLYSAADLRDPFTPTTFTQPLSVAVPGGGISPDFNRPREALEAYPLDSLRMVGTLERDQQRAALIRARDGTIHRVKAGNYMGQNHGKIISVAEDKIELTEIVPNGQGGWLERQASVALSE